MSDEFGTLYVVATPIGNLEDITLRALRILKEVSIIAAEDTRHSRKLLSFYEIPGRLTSYHNFNKEEKAPLLINKLKEGESIALITDSGTPTISDPGFYVIREAAREGIKVVPIPGACALAAAVSISGLPSDAFSFIGFLPRKINKRLEYIKRLGEEDRTFVIYESPERILRTLNEMFETLGDRDVVIARELTKVFEEIIRTKLSLCAEVMKNKKIKGEFTIVVGKESHKKN